MYKNAIASYPKNATLRSSLTMFLFYELQHSYLAIIECQQLKRLALIGRNNQYQLYILYKNISSLFHNLNRNYYQDPEKSDLDLERLFVYRDTLPQAVGEDCGVPEILQRPIRLYL